MAHHLSEKQKGKRKAVDALEGDMMTPGEPVPPHEQGPRVVFERADGSKSIVKRLKNHTLSSTLSKLANKLKVGSVDARLTYTREGGKEVEIYDDFDFRAFRERAAAWQEKGVTLVAKVHPGGIVSSSPAAPASASSSADDHRALNEKARHSTERKKGKGGDAAPSVSPAQKVPLPIRPTLSVPGPSAVAEIASSTPAASAKTKRKKRVSIALPFSDSDSPSTPTPSASTSQASPSILSSSARVDTPRRLDKHKEPKEKKPKSALMGDVPPALESAPHVEDRAGASEEPSQSTSPLLSTPSAQPSSTSKKRKRKSEASPPDQPETPLATPTHTAFRAPPHTAVQSLLDRYRPARPSPLGPGLARSESGGPSEAPESGKKRRRRHSKKSDPTPSSDDRFTLLPSTPTSPPNGNSAQKKQERQPLPVDRAAEPPRTPQFNRQGISPPASVISLSKPWTIVGRPGEAHEGDSSSLDSPRRKQRSEDAARLEEGASGDGANAQETIDTSPADVPDAISTPVAGVAKRQRAKREKKTSKSVTTGSDSFAQTLSEPAAAPVEPTTGAEQSQAPKIDISAFTRELLKDIVVPTATADASVPTKGSPTKDGKPSKGRKAKAKADNDKHAALPEAPADVVTSAPASAPAPPTEPSPASIPVLAPSTTPAKKPRQPRKSQGEKGETISARIMREARERAAKAAETKEAAGPSSVLVVEEPMQVDATPVEVDLLPESACPPAVDDQSVVDAAMPPAEQTSPSKAAIVAEDVTVPPVKAKGRKSRGAAKRKVEEQQAAVEPSTSNQDVSIVRSAAPAPAQSDNQQVPASPPPVVAEAQSSPDPISAPLPTPSEFAATHTTSVIPPPVDMPYRSKSGTPATSAPPPSLAKIKGHSVSAQHARLAHRVVCVICGVSPSHLQKDCPVVKAGLPALEDLQAQRTAETEEEREEGEKSEWAKKSLETIGRWVDRLRRIRGKVEGSPGPSHQPPAIPGQMSRIPVDPAADSPRSNGITAESDVEPVEPETSANERATSPAHSIAAPAPLADPSTLPAIHLKALRKSRRPGSITGLSVSSAVIETGESASESDSDSDSADDSGSDSDSDSESDGGPGSGTSSAEDDSDDDTGSTPSNPDISFGDLLRKPLSQTQRRRARESAANMTDPRPDSSSVGGSSSESEESISAESEGEVALRRRRERSDSSIGDFVEPSASRQIAAIPSAEDDEDAESDILPSSHAPPPVLEKTDETLSTSSRSTSRRSFAELERDLNSPIVEDFEGVQALQEAMAEDVRPEKEVLVEETVDGKAKKGWRVEGGLISPRSSSGEIVGDEHPLPAEQMDEEEAVVPTQLADASQPRRSGRPRKTVDRLVDSLSQRELAESPSSPPQTGLGPAAEIVDPEAHVALPNGHEIPTSPTRRGSAVATSPLRSTRMLRSASRDLTAASRDLTKSPESQRTPRASLRRKSSSLQPAEGPLANGTASQTTPLRQGRSGSRELRSSQVDQLESSQVIPLPPAHQPSPIAEEPEPTPDPASTPPRPARTLRSSASRSPLFMPHSQLAQTQAYNAFPSSLGLESLAQVSSTPATANGHIANGSSSEAGSARTTRRAMVSAKVSSPIAEEGEDEYDDAPSDGDDRAASPAPSDQSSRSSADEGQDPDESTVHAPSLLLAPRGRAPAASQPALAPTSSIPSLSSLPLELISRGRSAMHSMWGTSSQPTPTKARLKGGESESESDSSSSSDEEGGGGGGAKAAAGRGRARGRGRGRGGGGAALEGRFAGQRRGGRRTTMGDAGRGW